jgi:adenosine deaminase
MKHYGLEAKESLSTEDLDFIKRLPKAELHAHLNGCIPLDTLQDLAARFPSHLATLDDDALSKLKILEKGANLNEINEFFDLFPAIYALTSTPEALMIATRSVLDQFLEKEWLGPNEPPQCSYLELRTTPRKTEHMSREQYVDAVLKEMERYPRNKCALIVSVDRRMDTETMKECVDIAIKFKDEGRRVVGVDLCGTPNVSARYDDCVVILIVEQVGEAESYLPALSFARDNGLKLTLHIAETKENTQHDIMTLLSARPSRLGHAAFLHEEARQIVLQEKIPIEICLSSNLLCKIVDDLESHHINYWLENDLPLAICVRPHSRLPPG